MKRFSVLLIAALTACLANPHRIWGQADDRITGPTGRATIGTITDISPAKITMQAEGRQQTFDVNEIKALNFAGEPPELRLARGRIREENYNAALEELKKIDLREVRQDVIKREIEYFLALCEAKMTLAGEGAGDKGSAVTAMRKFVDDPNYAKSYHYYEAAEVVGDLAMAMGEKYLGAAETYYKKLMTAPNAWGEFKLNAMVKIGQAQLAQGKLDEAKASFDLVAGSPMSSPEVIRLKNFAQVGRARCLAESNPAEGIALIEEIIKKEDPNDMELFGRAYNAMGACHLEAGRPEDSLLAYLHTDILFYKDPNTHAEALYHLADLWQEIGKSDEAVRARNTLRERYKGTRWVE